MKSWNPKLWRAKLAVRLSERVLAEMEDPASNPHALILYRTALATLNQLRKSRRRPVAARVSNSTGLPWVTLDEAAHSVGLTPRSLAKRIIASGGKRAWALCGRLPGKAARFDRARFAEWWASPANRSPARTKADKRKRR